MKRAVEYFRKCAEETDNPIAWNNLGTCYNRGEGVEVDVKKAVECYEKAVSKGFPGAYCNLGLMYVHGD